MVLPDKFIVIVTAMGWDVPRAAFETADASQIICLFPFVHNVVIRWEIHTDTWGFIGQLRRIKLGISYLVLPLELSEVVLRIRRIFFTLVVLDQAGFGDGFWLIFGL